MERRHKSNEDVWDTGSKAKGVAQSAKLNIDVSTSGCQVCERRLCFMAVC